MLKVYPIILEPAEEGGYWVEFPDLAGCNTCGARRGDRALRDKRWQYPRSRRYQQPEAGTECP